MAWYGCTWPYMAIWPWHDIWPQEPRKCTQDEPILVKHRLRWLPYPLYPPIPLSPYPPIPLPPKWPQDGPKMAQDPPKKHSKMALTKRPVLLTPFFNIFDGPEGPQDDPKMAPRWPQDGLEIAQDGPVVKPRALDVLSVMARSRPDRYNHMQCWCDCLGERWWVSITQITTITCNAVVSACEKDGEWAWWHEDKMTRWQDDKITRWQDDKVTYDDKVTRWQDEKMTRWAKTFKNAAFFKVFDITTSESIAKYNIKRLSRTLKNGPKNEI